MRLSGALLQVIALFPIGAGLQGLRRRFGRPSFPEKVRACVTLLKATFLRLPPVIGTGEGAFRVRGTGTVTAHMSLPPSAPMHQRLRLAEEHIEDLRREQGLLLSAIKRQSTELREEIAVERRNREQVVQEASAQLEQVAVGGFALEVMGLFWLALGSTATSVPTEIVKWFRLQ